MRKDKYKVQVGDELYQASKSYEKVFAWKVLAIWLEEYVGGTKTILRCSNGTWEKEFFASDVREWFDTREAAVEALEGEDG
jgi:hypothetical protein